MDAAFRLLITLAAATMTGIFLKKLKLPAGMLVGAILGSVLLGMTELAYMPYMGKFVAQLITGAFVGCGMSRDRLRMLPKITGPFALILVELVTANALSGLLIWKMTNLDFLTAMLSTMPGGMTDTPLIAAEMGADVGYVAVLQFIRLIISVAIIPSVIIRLDPCPQKEGHSAENVMQKGSKEEESKTSQSFLLFFLFAVCLFGACIGKQSGIPAGTLIGSMCGAIIAKVAFPKIVMPAWIKRFAQILAGAYIGCTVQRDQIAALGRSFILPGLIIITVYLLCSICTGLLIHRVFHRERRESMLLATPGGASDMALTAAEMGVFSTDLVFTQILRMVIVISVFPQLIQLAAKLMGVG